MWSAGSDTIDVFLGRNRFGVQRRGEHARWETGSDSLESLGDALDSVQGSRGVSVRIWLSGSLARPFVLPPLQGLTTWADAQAVAAARASEETGLDAPCCVSIDRWKAGAPVGCVAMEEALRASILTLLVTRKVRIAGIRPWWAAVLCDRATHARSLALLTVDDGESLVVLAGEKDGLDMACCYTPAPDTIQRASLVQRILSAGGQGARAHRHATLVTRNATGAAAPSASTGAFLVEWDSAS